MTYAELRAASDQRLIEDHDLRARFVDPGVSYFLDELARRETERLTKSIKWLTVTNTGLVLISAFLVAVDVIVS